MGSNTEKKPWTNLQNLYKNLNKEIKNDNFYCRKVGRVITKWGAIIIFKGNKKLLCILVVADYFNIQVIGLNVTWETNPSPMVAAREVTPNTADNGIPATRYIC